MAPNGELQNKNGWTHEYVANFSVTTFILFSLIYVINTYKSLLKPQNLNYSSITVLYRTSKKT